jgi:integrase/recombinase XerD
MRRGGVPGTPHSLRHWFGTNLVGSGADLLTAQKLLRHSNLQTTAIYVQVADGKRVDAIDRLTLPLPTEAERVRDLGGDQLQRCKQSIVRLLGGLDVGVQMSRTSLSQALRSDVRPHIDGAIDELSNEGALVTVTVTTGRAYQLAPAAILKTGHVFDPNTSRRSTDSIRSARLMTTTRLRP